MGNLREQKRTGELSKWIAHTEENSSSDEGTVVHGGGLNGGTDDHDDEADGDGDAAAEVVGDHGDERNGNNRRDLVRSTKQTEFASCRETEPLLPRPEVLDGVEEHAVDIV